MSLFNHQFENAANVLANAEDEVLQAAGLMAQMRLETLKLRLRGFYNQTKALTAVPSTQPPQFKFGVPPYNNPAPRSVLGIPYAQTGFFGSGNTSGFGQGFGSAPQQSGVFGGAPSGHQASGGTSFGSSSAPNPQTAAFGSAPNHQTALFGSAPNPQNIVFGSAPNPSPQNSIFASTPNPRSQAFEPVPNQNPQNAAFGSAPNPQNTVFGSVPNPSPQNSIFGSAANPQSQAFESAPNQNPQNAAFGSASNPQNTVFGSVPNSSPQNSIFGQAPSNPPNAVGQQTYSFGIPAGAQNSTFTEPKSTGFGSGSPFGPGQNATTESKVASNASTASENEKQDGGSVPEQNGGLQKEGEVTKS